MKMSDSITIVLLGDWNKFYIQPEWIATNVFESEEMEIGIEGQDAEFHISYRNGKIVIKPSQSKITFSTMDTQDETIESLSKCVNNYLQKAVTPSLFAYGLNVDFTDDESTRFAEILDNISDATAIFELGYQIEASKISRTLSKNGKVINMNCQLVNTTTTMRFNEHHANPDCTNINITPDSILQFVDDVKQIVSQFGYELEGEKDE